MSAVQQINRDDFLDGLVRCWPDVAAQDAAWLKALRARAAGRVAALHFPDRRDEEWRFTDLSALRELNFEPAPLQKLQAPFADFERLIFPEAAATRLVFVNGHYAPELSDTHDVPPGVTLAHLKGQGATHDLAASTHLAQHADVNHEVFSALNTSLFPDAALLFIAQDVVCERPLHLLFISTAQQTPLLSSPRCLIISGRNSACTLIEDGARVTSILVDQGTDDSFLEEQLRPGLLESACSTAGIDLTLRMQPGFDHSYYFIASFMEDHLRWHSDHLR